MQWAQKEEKCVHDKEARQQGQTGGQTKGGGAEDINRKLRLQKGAAQPSLRAFNLVSPAGSGSAGGQCEG